MTLLAGFSRPVADAQNTFRRALKALSEPGTLVTLPTIAAWGCLSPAATALLMTLVDRETPLWLDPEFQQEDIVSNLRFHTGAAVTAAFTAPFAVLHVDNHQPLSAFSAGSALSPEESTTVILDLPSLHGGETLRLSGPGIQTTRNIAPRLPSRVLSYLLDRPRFFPQGSDLILTSGSQLLALPRTTHVEVH
ncbi:phosphonate C-P lyase system protein PhnH [Sodalis endosymbiont of Spalangia cameroni]|uniref:phosphonate C-P lyase system protein PhnH n=1 Tax=Sodalis praecaptivus TaxID=1239307 RepID=UPI0031F97905